MGVQCYKNHKVEMVHVIQIVECTHWDNVDPIHCKMYKNDIFLPNDKLVCIWVHLQYLIKYQ